MENEKRKSCRTEPTIHKVELRDRDDLRTFFYISCDTCRLHDRCINERYKREICVVSQKLEKLTERFVYGHVSSFVSDEFYACSGKNFKEYIQNIKKISNYLRMKYMIKTK